jgi:2',3'-cyclic-nucleotide 2'-phosphodiesterase (5'-nucleotidase family)
VEDTPVTRRLFLLLPLVVVALFVTALAQAPANEVSLIILHTNDTHGRLLPFSYPTIVPSGSELSGLPVRRDIGGIARRAALVSAIRSGAAARGASVWLVDVGDFTDGTPFSTEYKGEADLAAMNAAGYQFATVGNHEFNQPLAQMQAMLKKPAYPLLLANATLKSTGAPLLPPSRIERVGPVRVALFGLVTREAQGYPAGKDGVVIADEVETAKAIVPKLRAEADVVVLLSHCGERVDERLAAEVPGIDVIVGGHSHSRLPSGSFVWRSEDLRSDSANGAIIVQAHQWGGELGRLDLLFRKDAAGAWRVDRHRARLVPVTANVKDDPRVAEIVDRFWKPIAARYGEVVGTAADDFSARGDDEAPYALVADAVREAFGAEFGVENMGGVRAPLVAGPITRADLVTMDPFGNTVILFKATGARIKAMLERNAPYPSGLRYRIVDGTVVEATIGGAPVQDDREYSGVTNSYYAGSTLKDLAVTDTKKARLDVVTEYIRARGTVKPSYDGRRVVIGQLRREPR